jgi:hypothetical protein
MHLHSQLEIANARLQLPVLVRVFFTASMLQYNLIQEEGATELIGAYCKRRQSRTIACLGKVDFSVDRCLYSDVEGEPKSLQ